MRIFAAGATDEEATAMDIGRFGNMGFDLHSSLWDACDMTTNLNASKLQRVFGQRRPPGRRRSRSNSPLETVFDSTPETDGDLRDTSFIIVVYQRR
jgi:hypothetical protein